MNKSINKIINKEIAVIGISVKFPFAENTDSFWKNLSLGRDCVRPFPKERAEDLEGYFKAKGFSPEDVKYMNGSYLDDINKFDYPFFRITPKEACLMNPNQRLFLETAYKAIEDAGYGGNKITGSNTGIFVGYIGDYDGSVYRQIIDESDDPNSSIAITGNLSSIISGRISYLLDLKGPSALIDTACSSSLVAVHTAIKALQYGECEMAIAGSVKTNLTPLASNEKIGIESSDGKTRAFDDSSDGTGLGEGVVAIILKPLNKAIRDRDNIYAVIKGSAINQDGNSAGLTAPNMNAQSEVIIKAWTDAGIEPENISYLEAHGTGTKIGDPIEIEAIKKAFGRFTDKKQFCAIGSLKSNIGHLFDASGIASLVKVILSVKYGKIPPTINFSYPNKNINFEDSPVYVNNILSEWKPIGDKLLAGVSSFGFSGTNCHVIVEEPPSVVTKDDEDLDNLNILSLSAKSEKALLKILVEYEKKISSNQQINLSDLCFTCNTGREHHNFRITIICNTIDELKSKLKTIIQTGLNKPFESNTYYYNYTFINNTEVNTNQITRTQQLALTEKSKIILTENFSVCTNKNEIINELGKLYVAGADIDWRKLYYNKDVFTLSLPTYQFDKEKCWVTYKKNTGSTYKIKDLKEKLSNLDLAFDQVNEIINVINNVDDKEDYSKLPKSILEGKSENNYTNTEILISEIWCNELGYNKINIYKSIYELGGDSILATKIVNNINRSEHLHLSISDIFKYQSIADLSLFIDNKNNSNTIDMNINPAPFKEYYSLTPAQQRMFVLSQLKPDSVIYNMPFSIEVNGVIEVNKVARAFNELVKKHEAFRTSFHFINGIPQQKINDNININIPVIDLDKTEYDIYKKEFIEAFDLGTAPLLRIEIIRITKQLHYILLDMHHIISDGSSMGIFVNDLQNLLNENDFPVSPIQYKDFAEWLSEKFTADFLKNHKKYWLEIFSGNIPVLNLPSDFPRPNPQSFEGGILECKINQEITEKIKLFIKDKETTLFVFLMSVYNVLLYKYTGQSDIVVGTPVNGRPNYESERIIGMFVNMLAIRNFIQKDMSFVDFMNKVKNNSLKAFKYQDYQFDNLVDDLNLSRDTNRGLLFDTVFAMQNMHIPDLEIDRAKCLYHNENRLSKFDITVQAFETNNEILLSVEYSTKLFTQNTISKIFDNFINIIPIVLDNYMIEVKHIELGEKVQVTEGAFSNNVEFNF